MRPAPTMPLDPIVTESSPVHSEPPVSPLGRRCARRARRKLGSPLPRAGLCLPRSNAGNFSRAQAGRLCRSLPDHPGHRSRAHGDRLRGRGPRTARPSPSRWSPPSSPRTRSSCGASGARSRRRSGSSTRTWCRCWRTARRAGCPTSCRRSSRAGRWPSASTAEGKIGLASTLGLLAGRRGGDRRAARRRPRPPRHQAGEHPARRRPRLRVGLRPGQGQPGLEPHAARPGPRLAGLHGARADPRRGGQPGRPTSTRSGCVFIECLTGAPPFGGRPSMRVLFAHLQDPPPDLTELRPDIPPAAARAVNRALEKEPEERPDERRGLRAVRRARRRHLSPTGKVHLSPAGPADTVGAVTRIRTEADRLLRDPGRAVTVVVVVVFAAGSDETPQPAIAGGYDVAAPAARLHRAADGRHPVGPVRRRCAGPTGRCSPRRGCATGA